MDRALKLAPITDSLNKSLQKLLDSFAHCIEWTDIINWLKSLQAILRDNPSPYINQKILLSKRLNQCINPILPQKIHEQVLKIHQLLFLNIRTSVDNNINEYIKVFSEDLGVYSLSILPLFKNTTSTEYRLIILKLLNDYYLDLGLELIPMLTGMIKSLLPVLNQTTSEQLSTQIQQFMNKLQIKSGRRYFNSSIWSCILKYSDCRNSGIKYLGKSIQKMEFRKDEGEVQSEHGFSEQEEEVRRGEQQIEKENQGLREKGKLREMEQVITSDSGLINPINAGDKQKDGIIQEIQKQPQAQAQADVDATTTDKQLVKVNSVLSHIKQLPDQQDIMSKNFSNTILSNSKQQQPLNLNSSQRNLRTLATSQGPSAFFSPQPIAFSSLSHQPPSQSSHPIKLDKVPLMLSPAIQQIKQNININDNQNNYPHHHTLVNSALIACLEDNSQFIKRSVLDFMFTHLRLKSDVFQQNDRKVLVQAVLRMFKKSQMSIIKRVNKWLFGRQNQQGVYQINQNNQFVLEYIVNGFVNILATQPKSPEQAILPLKIIQNFYMQHSHLLPRTLKQISISLIRYIFNFGSDYQYSEQIVKAGARFFSNIPSHYPLLFGSLGSLFIQAIQENNQHLAFQCIKYIDYCYIKLMEHEHNIGQLEYITITLVLVSEGLKQFSQKNAQNFYRIYLREAVLLIYNLLGRRESVQRYMQKEQQDLDKKYFQETGREELPVQRIEYQKGIREEEQKMKGEFVRILERLECFFNALGNIIKKTPNITIFQDIFRLCSMSMVKIQTHLPTSYSLKQLPKWFNTIQYGIRVSSPAVSLAAIDAMIKCLMFQDKHPIYAQFKQFAVNDKNKKSGSDYQNLALQKLWSLLDYPHMHGKIIDLIVAFSKFFPNQFTQTVKKSFQTHSDPQKQASIQRFSHFWRLTGFKYKDLLISNRQFAQLNKVGLFKMLDFLDDENPLVRHAAKNWMTESMPLFHRVIQPLFYELMKAGGDWYTTPKGLLIIRKDYDTTAVFNTFRRIRSLLANGTFAFLRYIYQQPISDALEELRQKVTSQSTSILTQDKSATAQASLPMANPSKQKQPVLPKSLQTVPQTQKTVSKRMSYIDMLIILCVKYVQGIAIESMGIDFYTGNSGVNTSAIQLLESLINYIENPQLCAKLITFIMEPLCKVLNQAVTNQEYITQIQLLNLLKTIFFNSSFRQKATVQEIRVFFKNVFTQKYFLESMLNGLNTPFSYVRAQFINFITTCIQLVANFLEPDQATSAIKHILFSYYKIIKEIKVSLIEQVLSEQDQSLQTINEIQQQRKTTMGLARIVQMEIKAKQQQKIVKLSNNLQQVAKTNQILSILHGVSAILNYFYDLDKMDISTMKFQVTNPYTIFDSFKSIVTLGFASSEKLGKLVEKTQFLHNMETAQSILKDLEPVYETILRAWPLSQQFVRIATEQFTSIGSKNFNFQKFSKYNKVLLDLINFVNKQKQTIWGKIFTILKPMFYRFPREIMQIYLKLWVRECTNAGESNGKPDFKQKLIAKPNVGNTEFLMKILETIIVSNFPRNIIVHAFLQTSMLEELKVFYSQKINAKGITLSFHISQIQSKLLYFLYSYFMYSYIDQKELSKQNLLNIWSVILQSIRPFLSSQTPTTSIWILDILNMCSVKYSPKQILSNQKFKTDLHGVINQLLKQIASVASKKIPIFYQDPTKAGFNQVEGDDSKYRLVLPIPPSIFQIYKMKTKEKNDIDKELFVGVKVGDIISMEKINRLWCFKSLKKIGYEILQNTYLTQKSHFAVIRACEWMQIILPTIEDKSTQNIIYAQSASQILYYLLEQSRILFIKPLRTSILRIFDKDDFFICNKNTLHYWARIIDWMVSIDKNNQTFSEYLAKVNLSSSYFTNQNTENKKRIKSFERICFILFSGQQDKYAFKIKGLLEKIADVIKIAETAHPALLVLILFSLRILILRLSEIALNQLFIDIWPMILAFLMQIFSKKLVKVQVANEISRNPNLMLAALKLIEMISINNLGEFAHHQWIFIYDYFGLKISLTENSVQLGQILSERSQLTPLVSINRNQTPSPFLYKPYMLNYLPNYSISYQNQENKQEKRDYEPIKRVVIVKNSFVSSEDELKAYVYLLSQYLVKLDEYRMSIDNKDMQEVIINDFIKLDSFIYKI